MIIGSDTSLVNSTELQIIGGRYRVFKPLSANGGVTIYRVSDSVTDRQLALKQLTKSKNATERVVRNRVFEREYYTLVEFAHPHIVEVYDYGTDENGPYYTMELLDGGDLLELSPLSWKKTCSILRDVCSALSLLHSRRLLHHDLNPRTICLTRSGHAKLLDFCTVTPMGPCKQIIGTPPFTAPEVVNYQSLNARTDLYSLGATAYYMLTGRNAFPAESFEHLLDLWRSTPMAPSYFIKDIPFEVDRLVISLINLYPLTRPMNAAEVWERLNVILGLPDGDPRPVAQIHLSAPALIGRENPTLRVRKQMIRALRGRGGVVVIEGEPGVGRSRFLDACVMEGKIAGKTVLRANAGDTQGGDYGVARALARRLIDTAPEIALSSAEPYASTLIHLLPDLNHKLIRYGKKPGLVNPNSLRVLRPRIQTVLREWILKVSTKLSLMIAVDDMHRFDEPSVALLALIAAQTARSSLVIVATLETGAHATAPESVKLMRETALEIKLENLNLGECEKVLRSLFGSPEGLSDLSGRLFDRSKGNPRTVLDLAQYLMDRKKIRFHAGEWFLPPAAESGELPQGLREIVHERVSNLSGVARALLEALSLCPNHAFSIKEYSFLISYSDPIQINRALGELVAAQLISSEGSFFLFNQRGWIAARTCSLEQRREREIHSRLATIFQERGANELPVAHHWFCAGEDDRALDVLIDFLERLIKLSNTLGIETSSEFLHTLQLNVDLLERALERAQSCGRPARDAMVLQRILVSVGVYSASPKTRVYSAAVFDRLVQDSGLRAYETLDASLEPKQRIERALAVARKRYNEIAERERTFTVEEALRGLIQHGAEIMAFSIAVQDPDLLESLPSLEPFYPLSPTFEISQKAIFYARYNLSGRYELSYRGWSDAECRLRSYKSTRSEARLVDAIHHGLIYSLGLAEAGLGLPQALSRAEQLDREPLQQVNAWRIRLAYHVYHRNQQQAKICRKKAEMLQIQNSHNQLYKGISLLIDISTYTEGDKAEKLDETLARIEVMADEHPGWIPWLHRARGEYFRIRGDLERARNEFEKALGMSDPERDAVWYFTAASHLNILIYQGQMQRAVEIGKQRVALADKLGMGILSSIIKETLAIAEALQGDHDKAIERITRCIEEGKAMGMRGFNVGLAYELLSLIAIWMNDTKAFYIYAKQCAEQYRICDSPELVIRYDKLMDEARRANIAVSRRLKRAAQSRTTSTTEIGINIELAFARCQGLQEIAERGIDLLVKRCHAAHGYLYTLNNNAPVLSAKFDDQDEPEGLHKMIRDYLTAELAETEVVTMTSADRLAGKGIPTDWTCDRGNQYHPVLLGSDTAEGFLITGVAALCKKTDGELIVNWDVVSALSNVLLKAGKVATAKAAR